MSVPPEWFPVVREDNARVVHHSFPEIPSRDTGLSVIPGIGSDERTQTRPSIMKAAPRKR